MPSPEEWRRILTRLAKELRQRGQQDPIELVVIGGVAVALRYESRRTTKDCDVVTLNGAAVEAAKAVAAEFGLDEKWLNDEATRAGFVQEDIEIDPAPVFEDPPLVVRVPNHLPLLALKLVGVRGESDLQDVATILRHMRRNGWASSNDAWNVVGHLVPLAKRNAARYHLEAAWDLMEEQ